MPSFTWISTLSFFGIAVILPTAALLLPVKDSSAVSRRGSVHSFVMALGARDVAQVGIEDERAQSANAAAGAGVNTAPTHLVVLVHGLHGTPEDLSYLKEALERSGGVGTLVHLARCNKNRTLDGVAEGGTRLAKEVLEVVESKPSLRSISLVGNSLGGLYARYAAKLLYREADSLEPDVDDTDDAGDIRFKRSMSAITRNLTEALGVAGRQREFSTGDLSATILGERDVQRLAGGITNSTTTSVGTSGELKGDNGSGSGSGGTVAGLRPAAFMTIAAPNLGMRRFTYIPVPSPLHGLASVLVGKTGSDLFLDRRRTDPSQAERTVTPARMIASAASVTAAMVETLLGKRTKDFDVGGNRDSALARTSASSEREEAPLLYRMATSEEFLKPLKAFQTRRAYANRRGDFMVPYETAAFVGPNERNGAKELPEEPKALGIVDKVLGAKQGAIVGTSSAPLSMSNTVSDVGERKDAEAMEDQMAAGLNSCGWQKVSVDFGGLLPFSHNKICALSRTRVTTALWGAGRNIMDHAAEFVVGGYPETKGGVDTPPNDNKTKR